MERCASPLAVLAVAAVLAAALPGSGAAQTNTPGSMRPAQGRIIPPAARGAFAPCASGITYRPVIGSAAGAGTNLRAAELQVRGRVAQRAHIDSEAVLLVVRGWGEIVAGEDTARLGPGSLAYVPAGLRYSLAGQSPRQAPLELLLVLRPLTGRAPVSDRASFGCGQQGTMAPSATPMTDRPKAALFVVDPTYGERIAYCVFPLTITAQIDSNAVPAARLTAATGALRRGTEQATHRTDDELVFVTHGAGRAFVGSDTAAVEPGSAIFTPRGSPHGFINDGNGTGTLEYFIVFSEPGPRELFHQFAARPGPYCPSGPPLP